MHVTSGSGKRASRRGGAQVEEARSVSQYGITWTFDQPYTVGRFVTGDWWVLGPATIAQVRQLTVPRRLGKRARKSRGSTV